MRGGREFGTVENLLGDAVEGLSTLGLFDGKGIRCTQLPGFGTGCGDDALEGALGSVASSVGNEGSTWLFV